MDKTKELIHLIEDAFIEAGKRAVENNIQFNYDDKYFSPPIKIENEDQLKEICLNLDNEYMFNRIVKNKKEKDYPFYIIADDYHYFVKEVDDKYDGWYTSSEME